MPTRSAAAKGDLSITRDSGEHYTQDEPKQETTLEALEPTFAQRWLIAEGIAGRGNLKPLISLLSEIAADTSRVDHRLIALVLDGVIDRVAGAPTRQRKLGEDHRQFAERQARTGRPQALATYLRNLHQEDREASLGIDNWFAPNYLFLAELLERRTSRRRGRPQGWLEAALRDARIEWEYRALCARGIPSIAAILRIVRSTRLSETSVRRALKQRSKP